MSDTLHQQTLQRLRQRLDDMGDIPIFTASVNRVQAVGSDPDADAMALAVEILKAASLTTKLLRLANSPTHNRGTGKIANLSRAVVVLGFNTVRSVVLTLKLIDSFNQQNPGVDITAMLVNAYLTAGFVRGISARCDVRDIEQSYICGLLHNLGEVATACALPQEYKQILALRQQQSLTPREAENRVLGASLQQLGQAIADDWGFPKSVSQTIATQRQNNKQPIRNQTDLSGALSSLAAQTIQLLYTEHPATDKILPELIADLSLVSGIKKEQVSEALEQAFKQCCDMAQAYGLDRRHLTPHLRTGNDESLNKLAQHFSFYARQEVADNRPAATTPATSAPTGDANVLLSCLFDITQLMTQKASINTVFAKVLEGLHRGAGFDRAILCLLSPDRHSYAGRLCAGDGADTLMACCHFPLDTTNDLFSQIIMDGRKLLVPDVNQGNWPLPTDFAQVSGADSFIISSLSSRSRPVGMFYADRALSHAPIDDTAQRNFQQLVAQAQIALLMR